jgi:DNA-directed RNA polymerase specialized sigma24 family protein
MNSCSKAPTPSTDVDVLLLPFLEATTEKEEEIYLLQLLDEHINPLVRQVLRYKLQSSFSQKERGFLNQDIEEVYYEIQLHVLERLRKFKSHPDSRSVTNLRGYVVTTARNACDEYLRRKFPQRRKLKDKIRYCLTSNSDFALWKNAGKEWLSGLSDWRTSTQPTSASSNEPSKNDLLQTVVGKLQGVHAQGLELRGMIIAIFKIHGFPVELDQLTAIVAKLQGVEDHPMTPFETISNSTSEPVLSYQVNSATLVEYHQLLEQLWIEIRQLPRRQRVALLCNLKNQQGINVITLFPAAGVATFEQIADALELPLEEFERLWRKLPLDDLNLAAYLGTTRQQVINLRRSARDRLMRRMKAFEGGDPR